MKVPYTPSEDDRRLIDNLNTLMRQHGTTQEELGFIIGKAQSRANNLLNGKAPFQINEVVKIAQHYNVSVDKLLGMKYREEELSPYNLCRLLLSLDEKGQIGIETLNLTESWGDIYHKQNIETEYPAIVFHQLIPYDKWDPLSGYMEPGAAFSKPDNPFCKKVNNFLSQWAKVKELKDKGMSQDNYDRLMDSFLEDLKRPDPHSEQKLPF